MTAIHVFSSRQNPFQFGKWKKSAGAKSGSRVDGEALSLFSFSKNQLQHERCVLEHCHEVNGFLLALSLVNVFQSIYMYLTFPVFYVCKMSL